MINQSPWTVSAARPRNLRTTMNTVATAAACGAVDRLGDLLGRDLSLRQLHTLLSVAAAGHAGIDTVALGQLTCSSSAAISRNVRVLGQYHHNRSRGAGMGLVDVSLDPRDNRRRLVRLTERGARVVASFVHAARG